MSTDRNVRSPGKSAASKGEARIAPGYRPVAKALHWLIALLVVTQFVVAVAMPEIGPDTVPGTLISLHFSLGVLIFAAMAIRFIYRLLYPVALDMPASPGWERWAAHATHLAFYFILLVGPFLGWASASAHGLRVNVFGLLTLPDIAPPHARWALTAGDVHAYMMWALAALVALHVAGALYHQFFLRDGVLQRMLPSGSRN